MTQSHIKARKIALAGLLGALALVLAFLEGLLPPLPMMPPGAKPGFSNLVNMYAAQALGLPFALFVAVIKGLFALFTRGATAGLMSLGGGLLSSLVLWLLLKRTRLSCIMVGVCGALSHNLMQLLISSLLMGGVVLYYIPALLFFGILSGILTGLCYRALRPLLDPIRIP